jgi:hypothetical protein
MARPERPKSIEGELGLSWWLDESDAVTTAFFPAG